MMFLNYNKNRGFTLIELSIVLVIVGFIVGGVLTGQELIFESKIKKAYSDMQGLETAAIIYKNKYKAIPGDHDVAYAYFGSNCAASSAYCNGNNNGQIWNQEGRKALNHLANAELIPMLNYELSWTSGWDTPCGGENGTMPQSPFSENSGYSFSYTLYTGFSVADDMNTVKTGNFLTLTTNIDGSNSMLRCGNHGIGQVISAQDAQYLDRKYDDGYGRRGKIIAYSTISGTSYCTGVYNTNKSSYQEPFHVNYENFNFYINSWNSDEPHCGLVMWLDDYLQKN